MVISGKHDASAASVGKAGLRASISETPRRVNHGGASWLRRRGQDLIQPQDGASSQQGHRLGQKDAVLGESKGAREAEDARITGGTRSLVSRLTGLNVAVLNRTKVATEDFRRSLPPRPITL